MKKLLLLCFVVGLNSVLFAQNVYFVYLQSEDQSPFYVRISDKIYSSAASGFLILPNLTDSTYVLNVGFSKQPESRFSVSINQNDKGFLIKKSDDGLALFDLQNTALVKPDVVAKDSIAYETRTDAFSLLLAKAADDSTLLKVAVVKKEEVVGTAPGQKDSAAQKAELVNDEVKATKTKTDTILNVVEHNAAAQKEDSVKTINPEIFAKTDSTAFIKIDTVTTQQIIRDTAQLMKDTTQMLKDAVQSSPLVIKEDSVKTKPESVQIVNYQPSVIVRHSESSTTKGFGAMYFDKQDNKTDTIRILIEALKYRIAPKADVDTTALKPIKSEQIDSLASIKKNEVDSFALTRKSAMDSTAIILSNNKNAEAKSTCKNIATEKDFLKLRKNMAAKENDDAMLGEAKKLFKSKCFSVEQIHYLSGLLLATESKYQFFDMAYKHVSDKENFASLQSEIKDEYYLNRFKALVGE